MTRLQVPNRMLLNPALSLLAAPSVAGSLTMQVNGLERVRLDSTARGRSSISGPTDVALNANTYLNDTDWVRYDTTNPLGHLVVGRGTLFFYNAPAGTGTPAWSSKFSIATDGAVSMAAGLSVGGGVTAVGAVQGSTVKSTGWVYAAGNHFMFGDPYTAWFRYNTGDATIEASNHFRLPGFTSNARAMIGAATGGVGAAAGSEGQLELQNAGSGACKIAFHRVGAYAAYLGLDTDNVWAVGGWSMGAVRYQIWTSQQFNYGSGVVGSNLVQRSPEGYIYGNYINLTADVSSSPAYIAGQNGDGFLRWYPKSSVAATRTYGAFGGVGVPSGGTVNRTTGITSNGAGVTHDGTSIYVQKTALYVIYARSGSWDNSWDTGRFQEMRIMTTRGNTSGYVTHTPLGNNGSHVHQYTAVNLNAGDQVYFQQYQNSGYTINYDGGFWDLWCLPS